MYSTQIECHRNTTKMDIKAESRLHGGHESSLFGHLPLSLLCRHVQGIGHSIKNIRHENPQRQREMGVIVALPVSQVSQVRPRSSVRDFVAVSIHTF